MVCFSGKARKTNHIPLFCASEASIILYIFLIARIAVKMFILEISEVISIL
ncbi:MAG: hypothetical protein U5L45_16970 [Saprospiraceae bacterium]|nr:hypothetical protein [Saprospiraceae bacterium]